MKEDLPRVTRSVVQADTAAGEPVGREGLAGLGSWDLSACMSAVS